MNFGTTNEVVTFRQVDFAMLHSFSHNTYSWNWIKWRKFALSSLLAIAYGTSTLTSENRLRAQLLHAFCSAVEPALFLVSYWDEEVKTID